VAVAAASAPAAPPPPDASGGEDFEDLFGSAQAAYEMAPPLTPPSQSKPPVARTAPASSGGGGGPTSPLLGYAGAAPRSAQKQQDAKAAAVSELYIPIAMIIVGLVAYLFDAHQRGAKDAVTASVYVFISCGLNLVLVLAAVMIGVKTIGLGLGAMGPALLKIAAVAILPGALGDIIYWYVGLRIVSALITLFMYYGLLMWLFDMDAGEVRIVTGMMFAVRWVLSIFVVGAILAGVGFNGTTIGGRPIGGASKSMYSGDESADDVPDDVNMSASELDKFCEDAIAKTTETFEAHEWLVPKYPDHEGLGYSQSQLRKVVDDLQVAGAKKVWVASIEKGERGAELCTRLIVEMPADPGKRGDCLYVRDRFESREEPSKDTGGKYITVMVHVVKHRRGGL
jgi:hypothetical protein